MNDQFGGKMNLDKQSGRINATALEKLRGSFDTRKLLDAVEKVDAIRLRIDALREELLKLHKMAQELVDGEGVSGASADEPIWELADDISTEIWEWPEHLEFVCETVDELAALAPDPDEEVRNEIDDDLR